MFNIQLHYNNNLYIFLYRKTRTFSTHYSFVSHFILVDDHKENLQKNISLKIEVISFVNIGT